MLTRQEIENGYKNKITTRQAFEKYGMDETFESFPESKFAYNQELIAQFNNLPDYEGKVLPNVDAFGFTFKELYKKDKYHKNAIIGLKTWEDTQKKNYKDNINQLFKTVLTEEIDYSEYSETPIFKDCVSAKKYKDGLLLISDQTPLPTSIPPIIHVTLQSRGAENLENKALISVNKSLLINNGTIDWNDPIFKNEEIFNMYIVFPNIKKNLVFKFIFEKNIFIKKIFKEFKEEKAPLYPGEFKYFREKTYHSRIMLKAHWSLFTKQKNEDEKTKKVIESHLNKYKNVDYLKSGYYLSLEIYLVNILNSNAKKNFIELTSNIKNYSLSEIITYCEDENNFEEKFGNLVLKFIVLYYYTNEGTTLLDGTPINADGKSKQECFHFWSTIHHEVLLKFPLNKDNFPIKIVNEVKAHELSFEDRRHFDANFTYHQAMYEATPELIELRKNFVFKNQHYLDEAMDSQTGYLMPYEGVWEIKGDPHFKFAKFVEREKDILIMICDEEERFLYESFNKETRCFLGALIDSLLTEDNEDLLQSMYTKLAATIRDAKVLIERDKGMGYRGHRTPSGLKTQSKYHVYYFPRVKYVKDPDKEYVKREKDFFNESKKFSGSRIAHIRRLPDGSKPSKLQMLLAEKANMYLPPNHTYVKQSVWGQNGMTQREKKYRTRSIDGVFYHTKDEMDKATEINELSPAGFEEYCEKYLVGQKYKITKRNNYDGGIDIRAYKEENDSIKYLLVQCKHWKKPIPPGEMRDFITACNLEESEHEKIRMFITSNKFSPGARELAEKENIILIDGDILLNEME